MRKPRPFAVPLRAMAAVERGAGPTNGNRPRLTGRFRGRFHGRFRGAPRVLAGLAVLLWLVAGFTLGPYVGRLSEVANNDAAAYLPVNAEATVVDRAAAKFRDANLTATVVVYEAPSRLTPDDLALIKADIASIALVSHVDGTPQGPLVSDDGRAAEVLVQIRPAGPTGVLDPVRQIRRTVSGHQRIHGYVTGPGGFLADQNEVFSYIDGLLLIVALGVVLVLLVLVYRSPLLPLVVLLTAGLAVSAAGGTIYLLTRHGVLTLNGQSQGILMVLVVGACTDYALLLVSRFREELRRHADAVAAMRVAYRGVAAAIAASGTTVGLALLCLVLSQLKATKGLGPIGAIGIAASMVTALTFLPAVLLLLSRAAFWPLRPRYGSGTPPRGRLWDRLAGFVTARARRTWLVLGAVLLVAAAFLPQFRAAGTRVADVFLKHSDAVAGQQAIGRHFPAGADQPAQVVTRVDHLGAVLAAVRGVRGVAGVAPVTEGGAAGGGPRKVVDGQAMLSVTLADPADSNAAIATVQRLRDAVHAVPGADAKVGGPTAVNADTRRIGTRDRSLIIPVALVVILFILIALLRAVVAPVLMIATVVLSFAATLGVAALVFNHVFHFPGADAEVPLYAFVFLVALGVDYNIFLVSRIREEAAPHGTQAGIARGLAATGGVITSAGVVLAATFGALALVPLLFLTQMAFLVGFGVLADTVLVRSMLLPALAVDIGPAIWWPGSERPRLPARHLRGPRHSLHRPGARRPAYPVTGPLPRPPDPVVPPLSAVTSRRTNLLSLHLNDVELAELCTAAEHSGQAPAEYAARSALAAAQRELRGDGTDLREIASRMTLAAARTP